MNTVVEQNKRDHRQKNNKLDLTLLSHTQVLFSLSAAGLKPLGIVFQSLHRLSLLGITHPNWQTSRHFELIVVVWWNYRGIMKTVWRIKGLQREFWCPLFCSFQGFRIALWALIRAPNRDIKEMTWYTSGWGIYWTREEKIRAGVSLVYEVSKQFWGNLKLLRKIKMVHF